MDAAKIEAIVKGMENFGGIFDAHQLADVKILDLPISLIVNTGEHWISIYIDKENFEIMDSVGLAAEENFDKHLCRFICAHLYGKKFTATPKLQNDNSSICGKFAVTFIFYRAFTSKSLKAFTSIFSENFEENEKILEEIFKTITKLSTEFSRKK